MSFLSNVKITLNKENGYITVVDSNEYPVTLPGLGVSLPYERDDLAIAIFSSNDSWVTVEGNLTNSYTDWLISVINNVTYGIRAFYVPVWYVASWPQNSIVYYRDTFYRNTFAGVNSARPDTEINWEVLTEDDYTTFETHLYTGSIICGYTEAYQEMDFALFTIQKTDDHTWELEDNSDGSVDVVGVYLKDYEGNLIEELTFSGEKVTITLESDGMYYVQIDYEVGSITTIASYMLTIADLTDMQACGIKLVKYVYCKCSDPCDSNCNEYEAVNKRRTELNNMITLYFAILGLVNTERLQFMGVLNISQDRLDYVHDIGAMIEKLNVISERCALCSDLDTNDVTC